MVPQQLPNEYETTPEAVKTVRELPSEMRPREEMVRRGARNVSDEILLAILLRAGSQQLNVIDLARKVLIESGGLHNLAGMESAEIRALKIPGLGPVKAMEIAAAMELGRRAAGMAPTEEATHLNDGAAVYRLMEPLTRHDAKESFWVIMVNAKNRLIEQPVKISLGTADTSLANPREVLRPAIRHNALAIIVAHNHPSGDPTPSSADIRVTQQLITAAKVMSIKLLDHIIVGRPRGGLPGYVSMRQQQLADFT